MPKIRTIKNNRVTLMVVNEMCTKDKYKEKGLVVDGRKSKETQGESTILI